jgi:hypothetical protein
VSGTQHEPPSSDLGRARDPPAAATMQPRLCPQRERVRTCSQPTSKAHT